jgi:hypothetical protein
MLARRREPARLLVVGTYRLAEVIVSGHPLRALVRELHAKLTRKKSGVTMVSPYREHTA